MLFDALASMLCAVGVRVLCDESRCADEDRILCPIPVICVCVYYILDRYLLLYIGIHIHITIFFESNRTNPVVGKVKCVFCGFLSVVVLRVVCCYMYYICICQRSYIYIGSLLWSQTHTIQFPLQPAARIIHGCKLILHSLVA